MMPLCRQAGAAPKSSWRGTIKSAVCTHDTHCAQPSVSNGQRTAFRHCAGNRGTLGGMQEQQAGEGRAEIYTYTGSSSVYACGFSVSLCKVVVACRAGLQ
jgi:hypothetical protein